MKEENQIKNQIAKGKISESIATLRSSLEGSPFEKEITLISSRFENINRKAIKGIIKEEELQLETNKISDSILQLIDKVKIQPNVSKGLRKTPVIMKAITVIILVSGIFGFYKFTKSSNNEVPNNLEELTKQSLEENISLSELDSIGKTKHDLVSYFRNNPEYLKKAYSTYSSIERTTVLEFFEFNSYSFDFAVYAIGINAPDVLCLINIEEIRGNIDWEQTQKKLDKFKEINNNVVCEALKNRKELNSVIRECPEVAPILITKIRENLSPSDLSKFKRINKPSNTKSMFEILSSYDRLVERINQ